MTKRQKRRERVLARPTSLPIDEAIALMIEAGWTHRRRGTSHHKFTKDNENTIVVVESRGKVGKAAVEDIARAVEAAGE